MGPGQEAEGAVSIHLTNGWMQQDASLTVSKKGLAIAEALLSRCCTPSFCPRICTAVTTRDYKVSCIFELQLYEIAGEESTFSSIADLRIFLAHERRQAAEHAISQALILRSNSLAHLPNLTARQMKRSGVGERELRRRWT